MDYSEVIELFLELRGCGASLASMDFEILLVWQEMSLSPYYLCSFLSDLASELEEHGKAFPSSLVFVDKYLQRHMKKLRSGAYEQQV